jgi:hypothetical protein
MNGFSTFSSIVDVTRSASATYVSDSQMRASAMRATFLMISMNSEGAFRKYIETNQQTRAGTFISLLPFKIYEGQLQKD